MKHLLACLAVVFCLTPPARAEFTADASDDVRGYVESNLLGIFYHELGHALIDFLDLPIFGQEEDAADVLSVFLIDAFWEEESAVQMAYDTAFGFLGESEERELAGEEPAYWDVHGPDLQRYYNLVCVFYGANPEERDDVADDLGLPPERAEYCPDEYDQANDSWGAVLDDVLHPNNGGDFGLNTVETPTEGGRFTLEVIQAELDALDTELRLPFRLHTDIVPCGEPNAFYDPQTRSITICTEFADYLVETMP
ncbi:DUF4344 domain-containing metallopeptidase [uncultured Shimia sp.]|uniref:DUF4344 domain-containing metallopeptidase n=1 Tax=uncultured Shimia sp. TaxID=573152 RepID=UPI0026165E63|nr:DUF4344 domain-containing metallopeptidase [uncultured Shimia sp.]